MRNDYSTKPDQFTGWQQRQQPKLKQFPLIFMNAPVDIVTESLTSFGNTQTCRVAYMGPRYNSNMKAFKSFCCTQKSQNQQNASLYGLTELKKFEFRHQGQPEKYFPIRVSEYRLFVGVNPTIKKDDLRFDSDFECGNLDLAIFVNPAEYDLLMRVDSNTKGHTNWFFFKVSNAHPKQKIKFNILNFAKKFLLYKEGMKPYVFRKSTGKWQQAGLSVSYCKRRFRYEASQNFYCESLSFIYEFKDAQEVYFAYCVPYSYSFLLNRLQQMRSKTPHLLKISYDYESTGGLPIPILTITNFSTSQQGKSSVLCTGRLHPGETQGSWMMDGFIQQLLQPGSHYLRDKCIFKIVPMVNVDGVVLGNFRTGIMGRDLNRSFHLPDKYNEVSIVRKLAEDYSPETFIDFHGHSSKKNVFIYGPDYKLEDRNYLMCRFFPKLISKQIDAFRYYSCLFKISDCKVTTGRAIMLKEYNVTFGYTVEASTYGFGPVREEVMFTEKKYAEVGTAIAESLNDFFKILRILPIRKQLKQKKDRESPSKSTSTKTQVANFDEQKKKGKNVENLSFSLSRQDISSLSVIQKSLLRQIMKDQIQIDAEEQQNSQKDQESDGEDQSNDYSAGDIKMILNAKFDPEKTRTSAKRRKLKEQQGNKKQKKKSKKQGKKEGRKQGIKQSQKQINKQTLTLKKNSSKSPQKNFLERNKSFSKVNKSTNLVESMSQSQTIDVLDKKRQKLKSFESRVSRILDRNPSFMEGIIKKRQSRGLSEGQSLLLNFEMQTSQDEARSNNVQYEWLFNGKDAQKSSNHFKFDTPELLEAKTRKRAQSQKINEHKKSKQPLFSIKKSVLPMLGKTNEHAQRSQKSMLSEILEEHQRKSKIHKNVRIMFL